MEKDLESSKQGAPDQGHHQDAEARPVAESTVLPSFHDGRPPSEHARSASAVDEKRGVAIEEGPETHSTTDGQAPRWSLKELAHRYKAVIHIGLVLLLLGWWIPGIVIEKTRHYWIVTTVWTWFFIGLIFFQWVPTSVFSRPIGRIWGRVVADPWFRIPYRGRLAIGWLCLLGLVFGSAFGFDPTEGTTRGDRAISVFGLFVNQFLFWLTSKHRKAVRWQTVIVGLSLQQILAMFVLKTRAGFDLFNWIAIAATDLLTQGTNAAGFFFSADFLQNHYFFVNTLSAIIFFFAFVQLLYYMGVIWLLLKFSWLFFKLMAVSGAEAVVAAASPFIGQGENAALVRPYIAQMTRAELHQVMASGFSTISGSTLIAYINLGVPPVNLITASVMSIPAAIALSKLRYPETQETLTSGRVVMMREEGRADNWIQAYFKGAMFGLRVAGMILCSVLSVLALLYTVDGILSWIGQFWTLDRQGPHPLTLELILSYILYPVAWLMGTPGADILKVSKLLGQKFITNEFVAYTTLSPEAASFTPRGYTIVSYALCGFANIGSLGIQMGVLSSMAPSRSADIASIAFSALVTGFFSTIQTAAIAGMLV